MSKVIDLTGQRFGRLTVIERVGSNNHKKALWLCICDCGTQKTVCSNHLIRGATRSCGCFRRDGLSKRNIVHNESNTRLFKIWLGIIYRCTKPNSAAYHNYGGRGISIFDEWKDSFISFRDWATTHGYRDELTLDRIDNDKGYYPTNCRWADRRTQANNMRKNRHITYDNKTMTVSEWSIETNIGATTLRNRLYRGWSVEKALTTPVDESKRHPKK